MVPVYFVVADVFSGNHGSLLVDLYNQHDS